MQTELISLTDIRVNANNIYSEKSIKQLADSIHEVGQMENGTVYFEEGNDGKHYTLIGGHRRFLAINFLAERGLCEPKMYVNVITKPVDLTEEKMLIFTDNQQRVKDKNTLVKEVFLLNERWNFLKSIGRVPSGKKRDWIALKLGYSARTIQKILTEFKKRALENETQNETNESSVECSNNDEIIRSLKNAKKHLKKVTQSNLAHEDIVKVESMINQITEIMERVGN